MDGTHWHTLALFVRPSFPGPDQTFKLGNPLGPAEPIRSLYSFSFVDPLNLQDTAERLRYPHPVPAPVAVKALCEVLELQALRGIRF